METYVKVAVELGDGSKIIETLSNLVIVQRHNWHHTFELNLPLDDIGFDKARNYIGKPIKISINGASNDETYNQFNGIVTDISITRYSGSGADIVFKGYSPTILLDNGENTRGYLDQSITQIFKSASKGVSQSDMPVNVSPSPDTRFDYMVQYRETNFAFLSRLAEETGKWFYYDGKTLQFGKLNAANKLELKLGNDLSNFDLGFHLKPVKFTDSSYDYINNSVIEVASSSVKVSGLDSVGKDLLSKSENLFSSDTNSRPQYFVKNQGELKEYTTNKKSAAASKLTTVTGISYNPKLKIGTKIDIASNDSEKSSTDYGSFIVIGVTHYTDSLGVYRSQFEAISANVTIPPSNPNVIRPVCESQPAVVTHNNDPDGHGRVKVKFFWQKTDDPSPWIRLVNHYAGKNKGFQFIPEVDDEVLLSFENGNPSRPFVMGSLYHGKANHKDRNDKDNFIKTIRTSSGNEIKFYDKGGEEEILIHNKDGQNKIILSLKDNGKITIQSKNKMEFLAKDILIEAEKTINIKSQEITIAGKNKVAVETEKNCTIKSMDTTVETTANLKLKAGAKGELKATAGLDIDGGPKTSVKSSAMMELNGGGMAILKGGIVQIN